MKQRDDIVAKLDAHLSATDEKKAKKRRQLELEEEAREEAKLFHYLTVLERNKLADKDAEMGLTTLHYFDADCSTTPLHYQHHHSVKKIV